MSNIWPWITALASGGFVVLVLVGLVVYERWKRNEAEAALGAEQLGQANVNAQAENKEEQERVAAQDAQNVALQQKWAKEQEDARKETDPKAAVDAFNDAASRLRSK